MEICLFEICFASGYQLYGEKKIQIFPFSIHGEGEFYHLLFHVALYLMSSFLPAAGQVVGDEQPVVCLLYLAGT